MGLGSGPPLDLRKLRYFVAVAEELHFGRAADRLYITQPVLSRQIRQLEQELGTQLLARTSRNVALTAAGEQLLEEARALLAAADATRRRLQDAAGGRISLTVGFFVGDSFTDALRRFAAEVPTAEVHLHRIYWHDQVDVLHDGRVDVAFVHLPIDDRGLELMPVRSEPRLAALPAAHPAAGRREIGIDDLADDPVIIQRGASEAWQAFHNVDPRPDGSSPRRGPEVDNIEEKLELVAAGAAVSFVPASSAAAYVKPGVVYVPVSDIPPIEICLAWKADRRSELVDTFVRAVRWTAPAGTA
jgi:DNA-binding transcriptional LysR family regulator